jgi:hypothetical protein
MTLVELKRGSKLTIGISNFVLSTMASTEQQTVGSVTLKGSADLIKEYLGMYYKCVTRYILLLTRPKNLTLDNLSCSWINIHVDRIVNLLWKFNVRYPAVLT